MAARRVMVVALIISVFVLLYFGLRVVILMSEADDSFREPDTKKLNVSVLEGRGSNVIERAGILAVADLGFSQGGFKQM